jgi:hypothetical protein
MKKFTVKHILLGIVAICLCLGAGYMYYWMNTPAYAVGQIQEAVRSRDFQLLRSHVDLDKVYSYALDDTADLLENDGIPDHKTAASLIRGLKGPIVSELIHQTDLRFHGEKPGPSFLEKPVEIFNSYMGSATLAITDIVNIEEHDGKAEASVKLHDKKLKKDFTWHLLMVKDVNNNWVVVKIENFQEYLKERMAAEQK